VQAVLVSGPPGFYDFHECDIAIPFAVRHGYPEQWFIHFPNPALSTREEAAAILPELQRRGIHSYLLVTSDYHTARAARIFASAERDARSGRVFRAVAAPDEFFRAGSWWRIRQSQKIFFDEWCKTFANVIGL
jgi:hypothetical protein